MDEYIKREDALKIMKDAWMLHPSGDDAMQEAIDCISLLPAADVVERKIGKWEHDESNWENRFICSACGHKIFEKPTNYCPSCGAVMVWYERRADDV